jgi:hypothetical protein
VPPADPDIRRCRALGLAGSLILALAGVGAGALPVHRAVWPAAADTRGFAAAGAAAAYFGLTLLTVAWLRLGQRLPTPAVLRRTLLWWAAPLLLAPPMWSRDVYSYLAQGAMLARGLDPYRFGPATLGGQLVADVTPLWQHTPAPYGPVFLTAAAGVMRVAGTHTVPGVLGMRAVALAGVALMVRYLPRVAAHAGADPAAALWLGALNPLVLAHLVAGAHNDALMVGLTLAGLAQALRGKPGTGSALVALAALVKVPAGLALAFLVPLTADRLVGWRRLPALVAATALVGGVGAATIALTTAVCGTGYGWVAALHTPTVVHNGLSVSTDVGLLAAVIGAGPKAVAVSRAAAAALAGAVATLALARSRRLGPGYALGLALTAAVVLGPVVHPWYLVWGFALLAATTRDSRVRQIVLGLSIVLCYVVPPTGEGPTRAVVGGGLLGLAAALALVNLPWLRGEPAQREPVPFHAEPADHAGGNGGHDGVVPELLTRVDVRDVHLDQGRPQESAGIA